jgi:hypothetical protein
MSDVTTTKLYSKQDTTNVSAPFSTTSADSNITTLNFAVQQLSLEQFNLLPRIVHTGTILGNIGNIFNHRFRHTHFVNLWPDIFKNYSHVRLDIQIEIIMTPSWNHTGLVSLCYLPARGDVDNNYSHANYQWHCMPNTRAMARIGKDTKITLVIPWLGNFNAMTRIGSRTINNVEVDPYFFGGHDFFLRFDRVTNVATIPNSTQSVDFKMIASPINIQVGGFIGGNRV